MAMVPGISSAPSRVSTSHAGLRRLHRLLRAAQKLVGDVVVEAGLDDQDAGAGNRRTGGFSAYRKARP